MKTIIFNILVFVIPLFSWIKIAITKNTEPWTTIWIVSFMAGVSILAYEAGKEKGK